MLIQNIHNVNNLQDQHNVNSTKEVPRNGKSSLIKKNCLELDLIAVKSLIIEVVLLANRMWVYLFFGNRVYSDYLFLSIKLPEILISLLLSFIGSTNEQV